MAEVKTRAPRRAAAAADSYKARFDLYVHILARTGDPDLALADARLKSSEVERRRGRDPEFAAGVDMAMEESGRSRLFQIYADVYSKTGNQSEALRLSGLRRTEVAARREANAGFAERLEDARREAVDELEAEARRRAKDGVQEPLVHGGRLIYHTDAKGNVIKDELGEPIPVLVRKYSDILLITLLKANDPEKFRENMKVDHQVSGGVLLIPASGDAPLTVDQWEERAAARRLGKPPPTIENRPRPKPAGQA